MKPVIKILLLFILIIGIGGCDEKKEERILGEWKIERIEEVEGNESFDPGRALVALAASDFKDNVVLFSEDNSFLTMNKDGEPFQKGTFELKDENLIMNFDNGNSEKYKIVKLNADFIKLKSDYIIITYAAK